MNTSLQCLLHTELFIMRLYRINSLIGKPITTSFFDICQEMREKSTSVKPSYFKSLFGSLHSLYAGYSQQDSQEFLRKLLEDISKETNRITNIPPYKELDTKNKKKEILNNEFDRLFREREDSFVVDTFYGQFVNIFKCVECNFESFSFEKFLDIPILLEDSITSLDLYSLLDEYFKDDKFKWDSPCEKCKKKSIHNKQYKISDLPEILILTFQRYNYRNRMKANSRISFKEKIDVSRYIDKECTGRII
jgi:ubiquitin carboxyl-terminal hydrolase 8